MGDEIIYIGLYLWCACNLVNDEYSTDYCRTSAGHVYQIALISPPRCAIFNQETYLRQEIGSLRPWHLLPALLLDAVLSTTTWESRQYQDSDAWPENRALRKSPPVCTAGHLLTIVGR